jgi:hypothetical protein
MKMSSKTDMLQDWFNRVWIGGDTAAIDAFFVPKPVASGLMTGLDMQPAEFKELIPALQSMLVAPEISVARMIETEDWLWVLLSVRARTAHTHEPVEFSGQMAIRFENGLFAEAYNHFDMVTMFEHLGALPPETLALCLSGERLN